jgi:hypothetical protein
MKSSNLARVIRPDEPVDAAPAIPPQREPRQAEPQRPRSRGRFERRTIEIRDQGFAPFRVR